MYHDYESKLERIWQLNLDHVHQPISPIKRIEEDLITTLQAFESHDRSKFLLQINLAVVQWQGNESHKRYTPNYNLLLDRLDTLDTDNFYFDENTQNPYVVYTDDDVENTIWYENTGSIQSKIDLIKKYNLGGLSLWHIGNLPEEARPEYQLNIFEEIMKNY
jgi:spore germination protein YaaH